MYGLVNKAIRDLVCTGFGEDKWDAIAEKAGLDDDLFVTMESYPDSITYDLVGAASSVLELTPEQVLRAFGAYWTKYTAQQGYGDLLKCAGSDMRTCLSNLDKLHTDVTASMPKLRPPSFRVETLSETAILLHYHSEREGLGPMVVGLLEGLAELYEETITVVANERQDPNADLTFRINFS